METWGRQGTRRSGQDAGYSAGPYSWQVTEVKGESAQGQGEGWYDDSIQKRNGWE